jgi:dihydrofolate reductase
MGKLTITTLVSLDGVMQAPGGPEEDTSGGFRYGGWLVPHFDAEVGAFMSDVFDRADAFLLGRGTWQIFASHWPNVPDAETFVLNTLPKHVATRTLSSVDWAKSTIVRDPVAAIAELKAQYGRELQVHGSPKLARSLLAAGVVDELNLLQFPVVLGEGKRLFKHDCAPQGLELISCKATTTGVVMSRHRFSGEVRQGAIAPA